MSKQDQEVKNLLEQYVNKTISANDFAKLFDYISTERYKHVLEEYMKQADKDSFTTSETHQIDWQHMYQHIITHKKKKNTVSWTLGLVQKMAVAASLVLIGYLGYQRQLNKNNIAPITTQIKQDLLPGSDKAVLKLADGSEIVLNNIQNGTLTVQGNTNVSKSTEGLIEYQTAGDNKEQKILTNTLSTPRGGQYKLLLPDKSMVWLNSESSITFPTEFVGNERKVAITGEVYFEVAKHNQKQFIVENGKTKIEVLGTHFNVNIYPNEEKAEVTLLEGSVKLSNNKDSKILTPGQQAIFNNDETIQLKNIDTDIAVDWKNGLFIFENASLVDVMRQIERWYNVDVKYIGPKPDVKFNGIIARNNNVAKLLKLLKAAGNIEFTINNKVIEVKRTPN